MAPIGFAAEGGNGCEGFPDSSHEREPDVTQRDVWGWFNSNGLRTSFDNRAGSCWESDDDGGSRGESLVVVEGREERKDGREIWRVTKKVSSRRYAEDFSLIGGPLFSCWSVDCKVLMRVAIRVWAKVVPRFWGCRSNGGELKGWRWRASGKFFVLQDSECSCLVVDGGVGSGVRWTGVVGSERVDGPKVLLEGAPLKAAMRQGGREGLARGLPRISRS